MKTYRIIARSWGGTRKVLDTALTYKEALTICEEHDWIAGSEDGYVWDLEIEEE